MSVESFMLSPLFIKISAISKFFIEIALNKGVILLLPIGTLFILICLFIKFLINLELLIVGIYINEFSFDSCNFNKSFSLIVLNICVLLDKSL